jgi:hypothetical protein
MSCPFTSSQRYLGTIVAGFGEINWDCTYKEDNSVLNIIDKESHWCVATSCVSEWESGQGQMSDEFLKEWESSKNEFMVFSAMAMGYEFGRVTSVECKINSAGKATGMLALAATATAAAALFFF